jgi:DNA-binding SARP family transcriptional activator
VEFRILGPLEVLEEGRPLALGRLKERVVLAVLLLHANEFVSRERLIDELWGVAPPATARKAVNVYISKLRKTLGGNGDGQIATADGGYCLAVAPDLLDVDRLRTLVTGAREHMAGGDSEAASRLLEDALALWRGPTLAGLSLESVGRDEVAQLDELRLTVLMDRIDCDLAAGQHEHVLGELQVLVREHPLRERLRAQQMLALYRADRQADALDAYRDARRVLLDELGIEPSESLQRLQQAILRHDPALEAPAGTTALNGTAPALAAAVEPARAGPRPRSRARRRRYLVAAGLVVCGAVAAAVVLSTRGGGRPPPSSPVSALAPNTVALIDPATGKLSGVAGGGLEPGPMAVVGSTLWTIARGIGQIEPYHLLSRRGSAPFPAGASPYAIVADADGNAWVSQRKPVVTRIGPPASYVSSNPYATPAAPSQDFPVPLARAGAEAVGGGYLWVISGPLGADNRVALVSVRNPRVQHSIRLGPGLQTTAIAYGYDAAWIAAYDPRHSIAYLSRVRPGSNPKSVALETGDGAGPLAVAVGEGSVWVVTSRGNLIGVDPAGLQPTHRIPMQDELPILVAVSGGSVWTANHAKDDVSQIDPRTDRIVRTFPLGRYDVVPCGITATSHAVFVAFGETGCG